MNKFTLMVKSVVLAMGMAGMAYANNDYSHHSLSTSWTGFYAGLQGGFVFNNAQLRSQQLGFTNPSSSCNNSANFSSFFPGIQLGYMYQFPNNLVSGLEAGATFNTNQKNTSSCNSVFNPDVYDRFLFKNQMQSSIKGRLGRTLNWNKNILLPYFTVGASFANPGLTYKNEGGDYYYKTTTQPGWLIGAGLEWAFMQNWSLRAEYNYVGYGNAIKLNIPSVYSLIDPNGNARVNLYSNNIAVSINYWI
jgi:outer membrane immunogenic protein